MKPSIYLDNASTTKVDPLVLEEMKEYYTKFYGNAGSMHQKGLEAIKALNAARSSVAKIFRCQDNEVIFTGSGTESINLALKGAAEKLRDKGDHIITTNIEHHAVLDTLAYLEKKGYKVTKVPVEANGIIDPKKIEAAITPQTIIVSVMYANNEIGTIQPIKEVAKITKKHEVLFHTDACQVANYLSLDVHELGVDLLSLNGSKIHGPKGVGCLFKRRGVQLEPLIHGGGQEFGLRSGTENIPYIVGFAKALEIAQKRKASNTKKESALRDYVIRELLKIPDTILNGDPIRRLPNNVNITFLNVEGEAILLMMDNKGIYASSGSACTSKSLDPSHVVLALGRSYEAAHGSIRFTLSKYNTKKEIDYVIEQMPKIIKRLREISPVHLSAGEVLNV